MKKAPKEKNAGKPPKQEGNHSPAPKPLTDFEIVLVDTLDDVRNAPAHKRTIALRIDGADVDVVSVRLDSDQSRTRQAKHWAETFNLDFKTVEAKLRRAAVKVTEEQQQRIAIRHAAQLAHAKHGAAKSAPVTPITLDEARPTYARWIAGMDSDLLDVVFGTVLAHRLDGDPVWLFLIGPPGDGKTEAVRSMSADEAVYILSSLKPAALISGFQNENGPDPSLLPKLDGKVLVVKDFTTVLTMPSDARAEILGTLRDAYDGEAGKAFGTGEVKRYRSRFGLLAAVTPAIESYWGVAAQLGERFLRFRLHGKARVMKVRRAMGNANDEGNMRAELSAAALGVLAQKTPTPPNMPTEIEERLIHLADFTSMARSEVARDRQGVVQYVPAVEVGTRVGKALKKLAMGMAMARGVTRVDEAVYRIVCRVALDCVPSMRGRLLRVLWACRGAYELTARIADSAELGTDTAKTWLDDLRLLGIVDRECAGASIQAGYTWRLCDDFQQTVNLSGVLDDTSDDESDPAPGGDDPGDTPPDSAPLTPDGSKTMPDGSGGQNHPLPYSPIAPDAADRIPRDGNGRSTDIDDSDDREREAIQAVEAEAASNPAAEFPS